MHFRSRHLEQHPNLQLGLILAAAEGGVVDGLKTTASEIGHKFGFNTSADTTDEGSTVDLGDDIDAAAFKALVRQAVALNSAAKAKPVKKAKKAKSARD